LIQVIIITKYWYFGILQGNVSVGAEPKLIVCKPIHYDRREPMPMNR